MSNIFDWDELNIIREDIRILFNGRKKPDRRKIKEFCDYLEFVLCLVYVYGWHDAEEIVGIVPFRDGADTEAVNLEIEGKTFRERISEDSSAEEVLRILETESTRDYSTGVTDAAQASGASGVRKRWNTMKDDKVRDQHRFLEGQEVGINDLFYTDDGDSAMFPGGFSLPENNVNCRCYVTLVG